MSNNEQFSEDAVVKELLPFLPLLGDYQAADATRLEDCWVSSLLCWEDGNRAESVLLSLLIIKISHLSWISFLQIAASLWLISSVRKMLTVFVSFLFRVMRWWFLNVLILIFLLMSYCRIFKVLLYFLDMSVLSGSIRFVHIFSKSVTSFLILLHRISLPTKRFCFDEV